MRFAGRGSNRCGICLRRHPVPKLAGWATSSEWFIWCAGLAWCVVSESWGLGQRRGMGIGVGIFLLALGAILTFAVDWTVGGLDLKAVGWVLMAAGVAGLVLFFYFWNRRRAPAVAPSAPREVYRAYDDAPPPPPAR